MTTVQVVVPQPDAPPPADQEQRPRTWFDLTKILALPLVTLLVGYWFNSSLNERQQVESNIRLYAEMMGRREEADSNLRKDMFNSILNTFMAKDPELKLSPEQEIRQQILSLELLAYNFHESLDIGPLFKDVERRITFATFVTATELRDRLGTVANEVIEHQLTGLSDVGTVERGSALPAKIRDSRAHIMFGTRTIADPQVTPGEGATRLCLSMEAANGTRHHRQFRLELFGLNEAIREVQVQLSVSQLLTPQECQGTSVDLSKQEVDTNFAVGPFDFPMIDNTRLSAGERASVSLTALNENVLSVALAYFPASRASLKDKPYYDEVMRELRPGRRASRAIAR
jgi:hypothetical protein